MVSLLGCPTEILHMILSNIYDSWTLYNVCLAGNQTLLSIAQPLIWREVEWRWEASLFKKADDKYQRQVRHFCADEQRANSVRSLDIIVSGTLTEHYTLFSDIVPQELPKLVNITHVRISFSEADIKEVWATTGQLVFYIVYNLPSLISLRLEGCGRIQEDFEGKCYLPNLRSLSLWYCDSDYVAFARDSPNVEVLEIVGGQNPKARADVARPYYSFWAGRLAREVEEEEYNSDDEENDTTKYEPVHTVRRIAFYSKEVEALHQWDVGELTRYFTEEPIISHPDLEELVIDAPMNLDQYSAIISNLDSPALRILFLNLGSSVSIADLQSKISLEKFESLSEFWIPSNGLHLTHILEKFALEDSPSVERLYFNEPGLNSNVDYRNLARQYADKLPALQSVGWNNVALCHILRSDDGSLLDITEAEWTKPLWLEFNGIGQWWEVHELPEVEEQDEEYCEEGEEDGAEEDEAEEDEAEKDEADEEEGEDE